MASHLLDGRTETYWQSDSGHGKHWIRIEMQAGIAVRRLALRLAPDCGSYRPLVIVVKAGTSFRESEMRDIRSVHVPAPTPDSTKHLVLTLLTDIKLVSIIYFLTAD